MAINTQMRAKIGRASRFAATIAPGLRAESPLRSEIFGVEQLQAHARQVAEQHTFSDRPGRDQLLPRLAENEQVLLDAYEHVNGAAQNGKTVSPGAEWLIDNFYLIEEHIRTARRHLPRTYSRQLPQLRAGPGSGMPRVYHIAMELIAHLDGRIDIDSVTAFIASYQVALPLKIGELWAVPIMLRLALIENIRRIGQRIALGIKDRRLAENWALKLVETAEREPARLILVLADMARSQPFLSSAFVAEFSRQLQGKSPTLGISLTWVEQRLSELGQTVEERVQVEAQQQASNQVSIGNSIGSLRVLSAIDWRDFVEELSVVERTLREDPAGVYAGMDFATRDRYRHSVENLAHRSATSEQEVARQALALARASAAHSGVAHRTAHVGYFLSDKGLPTLEAVVHARVPFGGRIRRLVCDYPLTCYAGAGLGLTAVLSAGLLAAALLSGVRGAAFWVLVPLVLLSMSRLALALTNWVVSLTIPPRTLPRMDYSRGIPADAPTMVVIPTMLNTPVAGAALLERLEVHYLANRDELLYFALLTDFKDAAQETTPDDEATLSTVREGIARLNQQYGSRTHQPFFLFHRPRRWCKGEGKWIGAERKRGKLTEFNALLRGASDERFLAIDGDRTVLPRIRFVITLDTDTELPRDAARKLVATMAHPLIRAQFDPVTGMIHEGYAILQPRVAVSLPNAGRSYYVKLFSGEPGIDPYTHVVSDLYQDLFQEGSFIGKGIYDVDVFEKILGKRFPDNRILSHDLLEGCYARSGVVSDIQLYEDHPWSFSADMRRQHRWIRGDWQIAAWIWPRVPGPAGRRVWNPLSALSRWKILDNLRRSIVAPALLMLLLLGWVSLAGPACWTAVVLAVFLVPALLGSALEMYRKPRECTWRVHFNAVGRSLVRRGCQVAITLIFLPYEAIHSLDAVLRTLLRLHVTHRRLLEWETASDVQSRTGNRLGGFITTMAAAPLLAVAVMALVIAERPEAGVWALPLISLWIASPGIAWWLSQITPPRESRITAPQQQLLRVLARRTWRFFDTFVGAEDNALPPDNFQENPAPVIAHRTSPTNIGLGLLSTLAAHDFGYLSGGELLLRTGKTLAAMQSMERHRGHFYNWYDTRTLRPMPPLYISTVDSGNLAGLLMTFRQGLLELPDVAILPPRAFAGLGDMVQVLIQDLAGAAPSNQPADSHLKADLEWMLMQCATGPLPLAASLKLLEQLLARAADVVQAVAGYESDESQRIAAELQEQCRSIHMDVLYLAPWLPLRPAEDMWAAHPTDTPENTQRRAALQVALHSMDEIPSVRALAKIHFTLLPMIDALLAASADTPFMEGGTQLRAALEESADRALQRCKTCDALAAQCDGLSQMDFQFLFNKSREQLSIGFNVTDRRLDTSYYDLLASESRLASFVSIAQGQLPQETWFALGRNLTAAAGSEALISWSGSMFEYLMPLLVMPTWDDTLLDHTYKAVVARQIEYGHEQGVPWGISESGYNMTDAQLNYQYRAFGIPGLGFKRGLADDLVIAPYATVMAVMVDPQRACENMQRLAANGIMGRYGFYEAIDYTPSRVPSGQEHAVVSSFMSHHQGMSLLSLAYHMLGRPMQRRFLADPSFRATELLLHERVPKATPVTPFAAEVQDTQSRNANVEAQIRVLTTPNTVAPEIHLLSNGRYHVMISNAGGGYSRWNDLAVTRWREDPTRDCWGSFCYIHDIEREQSWSAAYQPTLKTPTTYEAIFQQARVEFRRQDVDITTTTEIAVSPEDDIELRRVTLTNNSRRPRSIEVTSYAEVVIAASAADAAHPAFSNLFVQTQIVQKHRAILCTRRPRSTPERPPWMLHLMAVQGTVTGTTSYETDRAKFIGRGRTVESPVALEQRQLSDSQGPVLDPIVAIRQTVLLQPGESAKVVIVTGIADSQKGATSLIEKYSDPRLADRVFEMAWTHSQVTLRQINATDTESQLFARLAGAVLHPNRRFRADPQILARNRRGQSGLWGYSISGDLPIVLLRISDQSNIELVRQVALAHAYWRIKGLAVDLIIWNEDHSGYRQALQDQIIGLINAGPEAHSIDRPGGIFVRRADQIAEEDRILMQAVARVIITDSDGTLAEQVERHARAMPNMPRLVPIRRQEAEPAPPVQRRGDLQFFNGIGGFAPDGREYIITTNREQVTPAPWANVIANPRLGTVVSESGSAYTWFQNAHECRLTPWSDDPVSDGTGEAFYIRDDDTGEFWSPTPLPARGRTPYVTRHGMGYSIFEHTEQGIQSELSLFVATDAPVKYAVLRITNRASRKRHLSIAGYWEWVLAELRSRSLMHVVTEIDSRTGALLARNSYSGEFADVVAFVDVNDPARSIAGDRAEFVGRNGSLANPAAMARRKLSGKIGAGLDPCTAIMVPMELAEGQQRELVFIFGAAQNLEEARQLIQRHRGPQAARQTLDDVARLWSNTLDAVQVESPNPAVNILANGWLLYQTIACRMWGRSGFYQSGGAYGFRDQLQDAMALVHAAPAMLREHLLRCAGHQFREGDVQHWWHPPAGRGVRTHFSDDFLWLPLATCRYVRTTGDTGILDERIPFLEGRPVKADEEAYYDLPDHSATSASLYEHCVAAIENGLKFGRHGLPLMGCGDWNDGMNLVGEHGQGESVWLAFFLYSVLEQFALLARRRGDAAFAERCTTQAALLESNIELHGWDGQWYRRAYFDNGDPLGSATNPECQIDSIPQSWSVIAGAGDPARRAQAMAAVDARLVQRDAGIIQLFTPPFDKSALDPGYIKGYVPGVRENGGQYNHAAVWMTMACALLGDHARAWELFNMINPIHRSNSAAAAAIYKVEPYVVAADVYAVPPHTGRGGWTWYTGSAGWMYRLIVETLLGLTREPERLRLDPRMPAEWAGFKLRYRYRSARYHISINRVTDGSAAATEVDGIASSDGWIALKDDGLEHQVTVRISPVRILDDPSATAMQPEHAGSM